MDDQNGYMLDPGEIVEASEQFLYEHSSAKKSDLCCSCAFGCKEEQAGRDNCGLWPPPVLIPVVFLEREAFKVLEKEPVFRPCRKRRHEDRRAYWFNEAKFYRDATFLGVETYSAVQVVMHGSAFRNALDQGDAGATALEMMAIVSHALSGGFYTQAMRLSQAQKEIDKARQKRRQGAEKTNKPYKEAERFCIEQAKKAWGETPDYLIWKLCEHLNAELLRRNMTGATAKTIHGWLTKAEEIGLLTIPKEARKAGRPAKNSN